MVSKKILGAAIAAAVMASSSAFAAVSLAGDGSGAIVVAKESILSASVATTGSLAGLVAFVNATALDTSVAAGAGIASGAHAYIRFNLTNAKFSGVIDSTKLLTSGTAFTGVNVTQGGAIGDAYVIFDVTSAGISQTDTLTLNLAGLAISSSLASSISYAMYDTPSSAINQTAANLLASDSYAFASVAEALVQTITATDRIADVTGTTAFTTFVSPAAATASLGTIAFTLVPGTVDAAGTPVTLLSQVRDPLLSTLVVTGDLGFTIGASAVATAGNLTFGGVVSNTAATNVPSAKLTDTTGLAITTAHSVSVTAVSAMNAGSYSLTSTPAPLATAQFGVSTKSAALGSITRSGTTVQIPYVTTYEAYKQRLVLVNRSTLAAPYAITFTPEAGVTATAGTLATGTLAAGKTVVLPMADVVTVTGGSRTAATVVITAPSTSIDAATTIVNVTGGGTDTVKLN